ncbi:hypothetical protein DRJ17_07200 [Candidatus Woesearchaeota archaeon]|nr:MAG: hypothetical protein DRJ17_07200 [Candidatus Woesearchaeota archaeon]
MIILKIPRKVDDRDLREFILNQIKKFRRNKKHRYIQLQGEVAYSNNYVYFIFPNRGLELAFALSLYLKCKKHSIPCELEFSKSVGLEKLPKDVLEAAKIWAERKLHRKYYKLKNLKL